MLKSQMTGVPSFCTEIKVVAQDMGDPDCRSTVHFFLRQEEELPVWVRAEIHLNQERVSENGQH